MSLFDRASKSIQESILADVAPLNEGVEGEVALSSDAEILGLQEDENGILSEMLGGMRVERFMDYRSLQYALEDAATTVKRSWKDRKDYKEYKGMEADSATLIEALRAASKKAGAFADKLEAARKADRF